jgi:hypothetical protein
MAVAQRDQLVALVQVLGSPGTATLIISRKSRIV